MPAKKIKWSPKQVRAGDLKTNPDNPKIHDDEGFELLRKVTAKYGLIFAGICNKDLTLIDGHKRSKLSKANDLVWVFVPDRQLTPAEYKEINSLYDQARAGTIDKKSLEKQFSDKYFDEWKIPKGTDKLKTVSFEVKPKEPRTSWNLIIVCTSEAERKKMADKLKDDGYKVELDK